MSYKYKLIKLITAFFLSFVIVGCVHTVPLKVDPSKDMRREFPKVNKLPATVGLYISDDLKNYIYKQQKMGMTFQMNVGEYLEQIGLQMAKHIFDNVIPVNSLPPYNDGYKPDVEGVIVPEVFYCYGNAVGTLSGYIETKVGVKIKGYDLGGKVIWRDEALGESRSRTLDFVDTFLSGMEEVGRTGYDAGFAATVKILNNFNDRPPKELYSLLEIKSVANLKNRTNITNLELFKKLYQKGRIQYDNKNYYQALYSFEKAASLNPRDASTLFYIGVCYTYIGQKSKALEAFRRVVGLGSRSQEVTDAKQWIDLLSEPLKIAIVNSRTDSDRGLDYGLIGQALQDSRMYELVDVNALRPPATTNSQKEWNQFLERCVKKGIKIVIISDIDSHSQKINIDQQPIGDVATEHMVKISSKAYSAKKKEVKADITIIERTSTMTEQSKVSEDIIKGQLLKNGAEKLVMRLMGHDIY